MAQNQVIPIAPSVLKWARETRGFSQADVAARLKKDEDIIKSWESGESQPSFAQLEKLAYSIYKRPLAVFFLSEPPQETPLTQDFRTLPSQDVKNLSPEFRLKVRRVKYYQLVLEEIFDSKNPIENPLHKAIKLNQETSPTQASAITRKYLGLTYEQIRKLPDHTAAFKLYKSLLEEKGLYVFQETLKEVSGFSLFSREFPVICLNGPDIPQKKIFTLFHELAHILFNIGGIFRDVISERLIREKDEIEVFCNRFAAEFLVPEQYLLSEPIVVNNSNSLQWDESDIAKLSNIFKVSRETLLRRLLDLGRTDSTYFITMKRKWDKQYADYVKEKKERQKNGPNWHTTQISHLGKKFVNSVFQGLSEGKITELDAANFLGIKINKLSDYALLTNPPTQDA